MKCAIVKKQNYISPFTKDKERIKNFKETGDSRYIYQNEWDEACFQHDVADRDLNRITFADKVLRDKALNIAKDPKYDGYKEVLLQWLINFLIKNLLVAVKKN